MLNPPGSVLSEEQQGFIHPTSAVAKKCKCDKSWSFLFSFSNPGGVMSNLCHTLVDIYSLSFIAAINHLITDWRSKKLNAVKRPILLC
jgi:hypothetical protein